MCRAWDLIEQTCLSSKRQTHANAMTCSQRYSRQTLLFVSFEIRIREYDPRDPSRWPRGTLFPQKLALTSPTYGERSVGIVRSRTPAMKFVLFCLLRSVDALGLQVTRLDWKARLTGFLGLFEFSGILNTRKQNVSETGSVSALRWRTETSTLLGSFGKN
jgi:hypothetical protein